MLKLVTIMFADVVGSTRRAETMHPEDTRALMTDFFRAMSEEIEQEGGTVERIIGDGIMADFGVPTAHEDDPLRAVRAALAMLRRLERWNAGRDPAHQLEIRVGINTGEVSAAGHPGQDLLVTGDPVNVAARLEQMAEPGTILVGPRTARTIGKAFRLKQLEPLAVKGKREPIDCFVVEGELDTNPEHQHLPEAPLIGRQIELDTLLSAFDRCVSTASPHLLTILGEAGVGKSRLVREFVGAVGDRATILMGRCIPYGAGVTLWPLREVLEGLCAISDADPVEDALQRIAGLVKRTGAAVAGDVDRTAAALASTMALEAPGSAGLDPRTRHRETLVAWRSLLCNLAAAKPVVMIVQDIHWADELMLDVLDDLASRTSGPLQIVCPTRPEVLKRRPSWGAGIPNSMTIKLDPLSEQDSSRLIDSLAASVTLPPSMKQVVLDRCEGNPFFVEEVVRQLVDERASGGDDSGEGRPDALEIPDNVQGVLLARLDLLSPAERAVAQRGAVIGRTFWEGALESVTDAVELPEILRELERRNFITERETTSIAGQIEYAFNHALIRDVAYQTMPRRVRGATHDAVAGWIERTSGDRVHELAELVAHHLDQAHELAPSEEIRSRARTFSLISSRNALRRFAVRQAQAFGRRATELSGPGVERVEALESYGDLSIVAYDIDDAWQAYRDAVDEAVILQDTSLVARLAAKAAITATRYEGALKTLPPAEEVESVIQLGLRNAGEGDERAQCLLLASPGFSLRLSPVTLPQQTAPERAMEIAERLNDPELLSVALDAAAFSVSSQARYGEMYRLQARRVKLVPLLRDVTEACDSLGSACWAAYFAGHYEETIHYADQCLKRAEGVDAGNYQHALQWRLVARFTLGDWDGLLEDQALLESMIDGGPDSPIPVFLGIAFSYTLLCHELRGDVAETQRDLARMQRLREEIGDDMGVPRAPVAMALLHQGRVEEARSWLTLDDMAMSIGPVLEAMCVLAPQEGDDEAARALAKIVRNDLKRMELPSLEGHVDRLEGLLFSAGGASKEAVSRLNSSAAVFSALKAPWEEASSRLLLGELHLREGRKSEAERELRIALDSFTHLGSVVERDRAAAALARL